MSLITNGCTELQASEISSTGKTILKYFVRNRQAVDDLEGIARWRLADEAVRGRIEDTHRALAWLVKEDLLIESKIPGGRTVFSLNTAEIEKARALLDD